MQNSAKGGLALTFAALAPENLPACAAIAATAPDPWSEADLAAAMKDLNCWCFVALLEGQPVAFAVFLAVAGSADLQQLAVVPARRRRGIGRQLLNHGLKTLAGQSIERCLLEVRCSNTAAISLYQSLGFQELAHRPGIYTAPAEDGLLMACTLGE